MFYLVGNGKRSNLSRAVTILFVFNEEALTESWVIEKAVNRVER